MITVAEGGMKVSLSEVAVEKPRCSVVEGDRKLGYDIGINASLVKVGENRLSVAVGACVLASDVTDDVGGPATEV